MANIPISSLPTVLALTGSESVPLVQAGTTFRASVTQINAQNVANIPAGGLTGQALVKQSSTSYDTTWKTAAGIGTVQEVDTGTGLTGGPITLTGTVSLAPVAAGRVLANVTGGSAAPIPNTPSSVLDLIGSVQGDILYRDSGGWAALAPGSNGQILTTQGAAANPKWSAVGSGTVTSVGLSLPAIFTVTNSPVTTSGTLTGTLATQAANTVWGGPTTGAASPPTFRALVGADLPAPSATTLGGIQSTTGTSHQWISSISTSGVPVLTQPAFADISGVASASQLPNPTASTLGGVRSLTATTSQWINTISTSGIPSSTQPAFSDISGNASLSQLPPIGNNTILANISGGSNVPASTSLSALIDTIGAVQGNILYRNASSWTVLTPGTLGQVLSSGGASANPSWTTVTGTGTVTSVATGAGLTGGTITGSGTVSLASISTGNILANVSGGSAAPTPTTPSSVLDVIGSTQGQLLYRGGSSWTALSPGTNGQFLQTLGAGSTPQWASVTPALIGAFATVKVQKFTSTSTYTPSAGMLYCIIECQAAGAGGAGCINATGGQSGGGGGGAGSYSRLVASAATIGASKAVTVGTGGTGGGVTTPWTGGNGGDTSVGTICISKGGTGGASNGAGTSGQGGAGGVAGTGDVTTAGQPGGSGISSALTTISVPGSFGGSSPFGGGGPQTVGNTSHTGDAGAGYGSGGAGGVSFNSGGAGLGGAGAPGLVIITEFCSQ